MSAKSLSHVLVVDDEANIRRLLRTILLRLPKYDVQVQEADSAESAVRHLEKNEYDLVITDYRMGGRTGVDLLEYAHKAYPNTGRMLITAFGELDIGVEAINRGHVDGFMRKPWEHANLVALVDSLLAARSRGEPASSGIISNAAPPAHPAPSPGTTWSAQGGATAGAATQASAESADKSGTALREELHEIDRHIRQLRVRLGLGGISPEGYQRANEELTRRKADLEVELMKRGA